MKTFLNKYGDVRPCLNHETKYCVPTIPIATSFLKRHPFLVEETGLFDGQKDIGYIF